MQAITMPKCIAAVLLACILAAVITTAVADSGITATPGVQRFTPTHARGMKVRHNSGNLR
jgi:hypothetical protein